MCLYPKIIKNKKYTATKKNKGLIPKIEDNRTKWVPIGCGKCKECLKQKSRQWQVRLHEEIKKKSENVAKFVTLTISEENLNYICEEIKSEDANKVAKVIVKRFINRWIQKHKKSVKHWLVTELGHNGTERLHLHGIIWTNKSNEEIERRWSYGNIWVGDYVSGKTINYIIKYVTKLDDKHKGYQSIILCSPGIGAGWEKSFDAEQRKYNEEETDETYRLNNGTKVGLPIYYRNKIYNENEREKLWIERMNRNERFVGGLRFDMNNEREAKEFFRTLEFHQETNTKQGYGSDAWKRKEYQARINNMKKELEKTKF